MSQELVEFELPPDFLQRCKHTDQRIAAGEAMTMQNIADQLGLPFEFFSAAIAIMIALKSGQKVIVDPAQALRFN